jgi:hypothetical protein
MNDLMKHRGEVLRALSNHRFELRPDGAIEIRGGMNASLNGVFDFVHRKFDADAQKSAIKRFVRDSPFIRGIARTRLGSPALAARRWAKGYGDIVDRAIASNLIPTEGLNHVLSVVVAGGTQVNPWYYALFEGNYTPTSALTANNFALTATECTAYDEATRVAFVDGTPSGGVVDNSANRAVFTMNATKTVYGAALLSVAAKSSGSGTLLAAARFPSARGVEDDDEIAGKYTLTLTSL